jgi:hypothetical protein
MRRHGRNRITKPLHYRLPRCFDLYGDHRFAVGGHGRDDRRAAAFEVVFFNAPAASELSLEAYLILSNGIDAKPAPGCLSSRDPRF